MTTVVISGKVWLIPLYLFYHNVGMAGSRWDEIFLFSPKGYILSWTQSLDMEKMTAVIPPSNSFSCLPKLHYSTGLPALDEHALLCA